MYKQFLDALSEYCSEKFCYNFQSVNVIAVSITDFNYACIYKSNLKDALPDISTSVYLIDKKDFYNWAIRCNKGFLHLFYHQYVIKLGADSDSKCEYGLNDNLMITVEIDSEKYSKSNPNKPADRSWVLTCVKEIEKQLKEEKEQIIKSEENMNSVLVSNRQWDSSSCVSSIDYKSMLYKCKQSKIRFQSLLKSELNLDTKFTNRFYKEVNNKTVTICNYENDKKLTFYITNEALGKIFVTEITDEEELIKYQYTISDSDAFIDWLNGIKRFSWEDKVAINKPNPKYNLRDVVYYVRQKADIDKNLFNNDLWQYLTSEQRIEYLTNTVAKQNLIHRGVVVGLSKQLSGDEIIYDIFNTNTESHDNIFESKVFDSVDDAVHYLVEEEVKKD